MTGERTPRQVVEWSHDVGAADWIVDRLHRRPVRGTWDVGAFVPDGFASYARVLHPAWRTERGRHVKVRWAELARAQGTALRATTEFEDLHPSALSQHTEVPLVGTLESDELEALVQLLAAFTSSPQSCWFGVWEGYGWMQGSPAIVELVACRPGSRRRLRGPERGGPTASAPAGPRVQLPDRSLALYSGPIDAATAFCRPPAHQSPNLWWPEDHAWCIASEIDFRSTYLGGAQTLIDGVLQHERLEGLRIRLGDRVTD